MIRMLTIKQAAEETNTSYNFIRKLCLEGKVFFVKTGNKFLINSNSLAAYLNGEG